MRCVLLAALVMAAGQALAQVGGTVAIVSDYRYRGATLSHGRSEAQLHLGIDGTDGWYAGGFVSGVDLRDEYSAHLQLLAYAGRAARDEYSAHLQLLAYAGRAARDETGTAWDGGIIASVFPQAAAYNYFEAYAGFTGALFSGRLSASPDYFGSGAATLYAECNASIDLGHAMRAEMHTGYLHASSHPATRALYHADGPDLSLGLSAGISRARLTLSWTVARQAGNAWALKLALPL